MVLAADNCPMRNTEKGRALQTVLWVIWVAEAKGRCGVGAGGLGAGEGLQVQRCGSQGLVPSGLGGMESSELGVR